MYLRSTYRPIGRDHQVHQVCRELIRWGGPFITDVLMVHLQLLRRWVPTYPTYPSKVDMYGSAKHTVQIKIPLPFSRLALRMESSLPTYYLGS